MRVQINGSVVHGESPANAQHDPRQGDGRQQKQLSAIAFQKIAEVEQQIVYTHFAYHTILYGGIWHNMPVNTSSMLRILLVFYHPIRIYSVSFCRIRNKNMRYSTDQLPVL